MRMHTLALLIQVISSRATMDLPDQWTIVLEDEHRRHFHSRTLRRLLVAR